MRAATAGAAAFSVAAARDARAHAEEPGAILPEGALLARVDAALALLDHPDALPTIFRDVASLKDGAGHPSLVRSALKSLLMLGVFRDLSEDERTSPEIQRRMRSVVPEIEVSVGGMARLLASLPAEAKEQVQQRLRADRDLPGRLCAALDANVPVDMVSLSRKMQWRSIAADVVFRLERQPPALVIDELVQRYRRAAASYPVDTSVWDDASEVAEPGRASDARRRGDKPPERLGCRKFLPQRCIDFDEPVVTAGLVLCGLGVAVPVAGVVCGMVTPLGCGVSVVSVTVGALLLIVGMIVLAIGAGITIAKDRAKSEVDDESTSLSLSPSGAQRY